MNDKTLKWLRGCGITLLVLFILLAAGLLVSRYLFRQYMLKRVTPAEYTEMVRFFEEPVELPAEWQQVDPFPEEVLRRSESLYKQWSHLSKDKALDSIYRDCFDSLRQGKKLTEDEWKKIEIFFNTNQGFSDDLAGLVATEGYELEAFPSPSPGIDLPDFLFAQISAKFLCLEAHWLARQERWEEAFDRALTALRLARRHPAAVLITHLIAVASEGIATHTLATLAKDCDDPAALRATLEEMNRLDPFVNLDNLDDAHLIDIVGGLRQLQRKGKEVDLSKRTPRGYYFQQWVQIMEKQNPQGCVKTFSSRGVVAYILGPRTVLEMLYTIGIPNTLEAHTREQTAKAKYDLARVEIAGRIVQLETGTVPAYIQDFIPKYLASSPSDPFSNNPYLNDSSRQVFYSIGPDGRDDGNGLLYDPTNGIVSNGDISLAAGGSR